MLPLDLRDRQSGGANATKRDVLEQTAAILTEARAFFIEFLLAHPKKFEEKVLYYSEQHLEVRARAISADELLTWVESCTLATEAHPHPWPGWDFSERFPGMPTAHRRAVEKDAIGKVRGYLTASKTWERSGKSKGKPGPPGEADHPTFYQGAFRLEAADLADRFVRLKVYDGKSWVWINYPVRCSRYFETRMKEADWSRLSPTLVLSKRGAALYFPQEKTIEAARVVERKLDPHVVTVGVDLNVKNLAVLTVRQDGKIIETVFLTDHGLDSHRYRHLKKIAKKQWQSGKPVKGEHSNQDLWRHVRNMNEDAARKCAGAVASICARYPGCILLFERLRKLSPKGGSKSRRMNRRQSNQLRGKIRQYAGAYAYARSATVTVEVNPHGTSQHCPRCGVKGKRFFARSGTREFVKWGSLFCCPVCGYEANADFCASVNVHHSFYRELHWQPRKKPPPKLRGAPSP
jgi:transposase